MKLPSTVTLALKRAGLCAGLALLGGCAAPGRPVVEVTSPPAPRFGSGPIAAYDAYARAMFLPATGNVTETLITTVNRPSVGSQLMVGEKRPAIIVQSTLE
jgi:hypothetical protein